MVKSLPFAPASSAQRQQRAARGARMKLPRHAARLLLSQCGRAHAPALQPAPRIETACHSFCFQHGGLNNLRRVDIQPDLRFDQNPATVFILAGDEGDRVVASVLPFFANLNCVACLDHVLLRCVHALNIAHLARIAMGLIVKINKRGLFA
jgi:hypothetical protein